MVVDAETGAPFARAPALGPSRLWLSFSHMGWSQQADEIFRHSQGGILGTHKLELLLTNLDGEIIQAWSSPDVVRGLRARRQVTQA